MFAVLICSYKNDVWLWNLDWSTKKVKLPQVQVVWMLVLACISIHLYEVDYCISI